MYALPSCSGTTIKVALAQDTPTNVIKQISFETGKQPKEALQKAVDL